MEAREDEEHLASMVAKRKRTKLPRSYQRLPSLAESATLAASAEADISDSVTEEDEYMAKCLILLSRGRSPCAGNPSEETAPHVDEGGDRTDGNFAGRGSDAACVYECKTCSKCFSSFQALGGHRASHKKLKLAAAAEDKRGLIQEYKSPQISNSGYLSMQIPSIEKSNTRKKMHECTICGSEFSSGQALGGHMRRHRLSSAGLCPETQDREKKESNLLSLDLNLPAPTGDEEEHNGHSQPPFPPPPAFAFVGDRPFIFGSSASALSMKLTSNFHRGPFGSLHDKIKQFEKRFRQEEPAHTSHQAYNTLQPSALVSSTLDHRTRNTNQVPDIKAQIRSSDGQILNRNEMQIKKIQRQRNKGGMVQRKLTK